MKKLFLTLTLVLFVIPFGISQELPSYVPTDGLVAYYPFNGNANDESGNGFNGTVFLEPELSEGYIGTAYNFEWDEVSGYGSPWQRIELPYIDSFHNTDFVFSAWIKPESLYWPNNNIQNAMIIGSSNACGNFLEPSDIRFALRNGDGSITFTVGPDIVVDSGPGAIDLNSWQHVLARVSSDKVDLFINNNLVSSENHSSVPNFAGCMVIGEHHQGNGHWYYFDGLIDEVGIWNRALTDQEIQNLYTSSNGDIILNGVVSAENNQIKNVADPTDAQDAVTKNYTYSKTEVDALIANLQQQINEMNQTITSSELEGNWNVKELYYLDPDTNEITSTFPTPECSKPYQYYEFLASKEIFWTGIGTNWVTQSCTSNEFGVKQDPYTITTANSSGDDLITYINFPNGSNTRNWEVISRPSENTIIIRAWQNNEITLYNNEVHGLKLVKEARIEQNLN